MRQFSDSLEEWGVPGLVGRSEGGGVMIMGSKMGRKCRSEHIEPGKKVREKRRVPLAKSLERCYRSKVGWDERPGGVRSPFYYFRLSSSPARFKIGAGG